MCADLDCEIKFYVSPMNRISSSKIIFKKPKTFLRNARNVFCMFSYDFFCFKFYSITFHIQNELHSSLQYISSKKITQNKKKPTYTSTYSYVETQIAIECKNLVVQQHNKRVRNANGNAYLTKHLSLEEVLLVALHLPGLF